MANVIDFVKRLAQSKGEEPVDRGVEQQQGLNAVWFSLYAGHPEYGAKVFSSEDMDTVLEDCVKEGYQPLHAMMNVYHGPEQGVEVVHQKALLEEDQVKKIIIEEETEDDVQTD